VGPCVAGDYLTDGRRCEPAIAPRTNLASGAAREIWQGVKATAHQRKRTHNTEHNQDTASATHDVMLPCSTQTAGSGCVVPPVNKTPNAPDHLLIRFGTVILTAPQVSRSCRRAGVADRSERRTPCFVLRPGLLDRRWPWHRPDPEASVRWDGTHAFARDPQDPDFNQLWRLDPPPAELQEGDLCEVLIPPTEVVVTWVARFDPPKNVGWLPRPTGVLDVVQVFGEWHPYGEDAPSETVRMGRSCATCSASGWTDTPPPAGSDTSP
jgi:hypothetical protein